MNVAVNYTTPKLTPRHALGLVFKTRRKPRQAGPANNIKLLSFELRAKQCFANACLTLGGLERANPARDGLENKPQSLSLRVYGKQVINCIKNYLISVLVHEE